MNIILILLWVSTVLLIPTGAERKRYDGYQVLEIRADTKTQYTFVKSLADNVELDFWDEPHRLGDTFHVMVPPQRLQSFVSILDHRKIEWSVLIDNVQENIDIEEKRLTQRYTEQYAFDYNDYNRYEDIMVELDNMTSRCSEEFDCSTYITGYSVEGREIKTLKIDGGSDTGIWLDSVMHAREWLAGATLLNIANALVSEYNTNSTVRWLLDSYDWYISPITNPDGYEYTWDEDRMWRKNRSPNDGAACYGVDLNRNFDMYWGRDGAATNPCSSTYLGPSPASEPEVQALQNQFLSNSIQALITFHTYGRMWLQPYSHTEDGTCYRAEDHDEMFRVITAAADATEATHDTVWDRGTFCEVLYGGSGVETDYAHGAAGIGYPYLPELRGSSFVVPPTEIQPSFEEMFQGMVAMVEAIQNPGP